MTQETMALLADDLSNPILRAQSLPSAEEIDLASVEIGVPFSSDYREFLLTYGAAMVGPYPIFGLRPVEVMGVDSWSVVEMTNWYRADSVPDANKWIIISNDHSGNPVGMDRDGVIWIKDHDFGGVALLANSFEEYLRVHCLKVDRA